MWSACLTAAVAAGGGCAHRPAGADGGDLPSITSTRFGPDPAGPAATASPATTATEGDLAVTASALAFDPPAALGEPRPNLARADRQPSAFFGYEEGFVETYRLTVDDRQIGLGGPGGYGYGGGFGGRGRPFGGGGGGSGWYDRYDRQAVSERVGVIRR